MVAPIVSNVKVRITDISMVEKKTKKKDKNQIEINQQKGQQRNRF